MTDTPPLQADTPAFIEDAPTPRKRRSLMQKVLANWSVRLGGGFLCLLVLMAVTAPWLGTINPTEMDPASGNLLPGTFAEFNTLSGESFQHFFLMGTDSLGRDIWSRTVYGARVSLVVGLAVSVITLVLGLFIGLVSGYFRRLDGVIMRVMDGMMAIPGILFAVSMVAMLGGSLFTVILAIAVPEIPRVARLVRSVILSVREEPYVEAAIALDTPTWKIMLKHILPNAVAPLVIQATFVCASAILLEAILSFLGVGLPAETATWGNIMAEGRSQFNQYPHNVLFPGILLAITVLSINMLGDGLRDTLDPKFNKRGE